MSTSTTHVTMVKKRLASGEPCAKCIQAEDLLKGRGMWERVDEIVWADEADPESRGMRLSAEYGVDRAPFFLVRNGAPEPKVYESTLRLMRELSAHAAAGERASGTRLARATVPTEGEIADARQQLAGRPPQAVLGWVLERYGKDCALAFSGAEDVALIDMAARGGHEFSVFCLDTGRLHPETYAFIERVRTHYGIEIDMRMPDAEQLQVFVRRKGLFSFFEDGHKECCGIRKVAPLKRALSEYRAWVTGQRRDQSPATRAEVPLLQIDGAFEGKAGQPLVKANPLSEWSAAQTWAYIREHDVPFNALHERGFRSIGCEPCTRPVHPGQHEREGRWWWEAETQKECGLHK